MNHLNTILQAFFYFRTNLNLPLYPKYRNSPLCPKFTLSNKNDNCLSNITSYNQQKHFKFLIRGTIVNKKVIQVQMIILLRQSQVGH